MQKKLLTVSEVCTLLKIKKSRLYGMVFYKKIPYIKLNSSLRFDEEKINEWVEKQSIQAKDGE